MESGLVQQKVNAFACGEFAFGMLGCNPLFTAGLLHKRPHLSKFDNPWIFRRHGNSFL
jgi:hypothetical protein